MHQIRYFLALCDTLNFTRAAERCNVSQPSLTRAIHALELELGGQLIRRERSLSHLTELGQRMAPLLRQSYESALAAKALAQSVRKGETAPLAVAISNTVSFGAFVPVVSMLSHALPGLQLRLLRGSNSDIVEMLKAGQAELAIGGRLGAEWERFDVFPLFVDPFQLFVSRQHRFKGLRRVNCKALQTERLLVYARPEVGDELDGWLRKAGIDDPIAHQVATEADLRALLEANLGVAIAPASTVQSQHVKRVELDGLDITRTVAVYCVSGRHRSGAGTTALNLLRTLDWSNHATLLSVSGAVGA